MNNRLKKYFIVLIKILVTAGSLGFIFYRVYTQVKTGGLIYLPYSFSIINMLLIILVIILMPVNWFLEAVKWKKMLSVFCTINNNISIKAVITGLTVGVITPNRTGEFIGRIAYLPPVNRIQGTLATWLCNFAQLMITIVMGLLGFMFLAKYFNLNIIYFLNRPLVLFIVFFGYVILLLNFIFIAKIFPVQLITRLLPKTKKYIIFISNYKANNMLKITTLSFLRYIIFTSQFVLITIVLPIQIPVIYTYSGLALVYFITAFIPSWALAEVGIRCSVAILVFESIGANLTVVTFALFALWVLNIGLPALAGNIFLIKHKNNL